MYNVGMVKFPVFADKYGTLIPIEAAQNIPFEIKRVYYIFNVPDNQRRGFHSHINLHQVLICVHGSVTIQVQNGEDKQVIRLSDPCEGLYIGPMVWREMFDFTDDAVLLVLASHHYSEDDYIRNFDRYMDLSQKFYLK